MVLSSDVKLVKRGDEQLLFGALVVGDRWLESPPSLTVASSYGYKVDF